MSQELSESFVWKRRLTREDAFALLRKAVVERKPFSFVRMNDGEARILDAYRGTPERKVAAITGLWWGRQDVPREEIEEIREGLLTAAHTADLLAFYDMFDGQDVRYGMCGLLLRRHAKLRKDHRFTKVNHHYKWLRQGAYDEMLRGVEELTYISCYDLSEAIQARFGARARQIRIPGQAEFTDVDGVHWPDRFREVCEELRRLEPGTLVLVGAGVLGKYYCHLIKQAGGVALDLGSVFDFWANNTRRRAVREAEAPVGL